MKTTDAMQRKRKAMGTIRAKFVLIGGLFLLLARIAFAHCDGLDGPVVQAAREALDSKNVNLVLIWVKKEDEPEIKKVFEQTLAVRALGSEARDMADRNFFETLVRVHRAGEGAGFTGLKPAGRNLGPAIPAADQALRDGKIDPVLELLDGAVQQRIRESFDTMMAKKNFEKDDVAKGREFVAAYVTYIHLVEGIYEQARSPAHGHFEEGTAGNLPDSHGQPEEHK